MTVLWLFGKLTDNSLSVRFQAKIYLLISVLNPCGLCLGYTAMALLDAAGPLFS